MKNGKKILFAGLLAAIVIIGSIGTAASFSDIGTSICNYFQAGSLDITVNGKQDNVVLFTVENMGPTQISHLAYKVKNIGSKPGYLDIENISVVNEENGRIDPEIAAGDTTDAIGELGGLINLRLFVDADRSGWISAGDTVIYDGRLNNLPSHFELNEPLVAGQELSIRPLIDWWSSSSDDLAQTDKVTVSFEFQIGQTTAQ